MGANASNLEVAKSANTNVKLTGRNAVVCGATMGIGQSIAIRLAQAGCNVTIMGRSEKQGMETVELLKKATPEGISAVHSFQKADLMLLENCKKAVQDYTATASRLDYVVFCQTKATLQGRTPTKEGIDEKLMLNIYSRVYLSQLFMPLLTKTASDFNDSDPRVLSILSAGVHNPYAKWKEDPRLEKNYSSKNAADITSHYTDMTFDKMAQLYPSVTFVHACPGFVASQWGTDMPGVVRGAIRGLQAVAAKSCADCAEFMCRGLFEPSYRAGTDVKNPAVLMLDEYGKNTPKKTNVHTQENVDFLWNDFQDLFSKHF